MGAKVHTTGREEGGRLVRSNRTTVVQQRTMSERFDELASRAGVTAREVAAAAGVDVNTIAGFRSRERKGRRSWSKETLHAISRTLAPKLGAQPSEVYAHLTGLDDMPKSPTSASSSARGRRSAPAR